MLNNRLISILSVSSLVAMMSCSSQPRQKKESGCKETKLLLEERHLVLSAKNQKQEHLVDCFRNFLKFEKNKHQKISTCNQISISRRGKVRFVQIRSEDKRALPKDLKMCLEQEFWRMDFAALQIKRDYIISFPLIFSSLAN